MPETSGNSGENIRKCSIFSDCMQGIKTEERCTSHYQLTQCPFLERMQDYLSRQQQTR